MSLRLRLTLLYAVLMGGILLIFGAAAYLLVNNVLLSQVDDRLEMTALEFMKVADVNSLEKVQFNTFPANMDADVHVQVWGLDNKLQASFRLLADGETAFDPGSKRADDAVYRETSIDNIPLRVLSLPLSHNGSRIAVMQVAIDLTSVESARTYLLYVLLVLWFYGVIVAGFVSWFTCGDGRTYQPCGRSFTPYPIAGIGGG